MLDAPDVSDVHNMPGWATSTAAAAQPRRHRSVVLGDAPRGAYAYPEGYCRERMTHGVRRRGLRRSTAACRRVSLAASWPDGASAGRRSGWMANRLDGVSAGRRVGGASARQIRGLSGSSVSHCEREHANAPSRRAVATRRRDAPATRRLRPAWRPLTRDAAWPSEVTAFEAAIKVKPLAQGRGGTFTNAERMRGVSTPRDLLAVCFSECLVSVSVDLPPPAIWLSSPSSLVRHPALVAIRLWSPSALAAVCRLDIARQLGVVRG